MRKIQLNTHREAHHSTKTIKVMVMFIFLSLVLIGSVSAFEFDNVKSYDEETKTITIKNSILGIPFLNLDTIAKVKLDTPHIYQVHVGYIKIAEFTINPNKDYSTILGDFELYDLNNNSQKIDRKIDVKYWGLENYSIDDYSCNNLKNGTKGTDCFVSGNHIEQREAWIDWDKNVFSNKEVTIALFMEMGYEETFEWIPTIAGVRVNEWAVVSSGAVETTDGAFTVLTFSNNGTFNVSGETQEIEYLIVGGGGGGGGGGNQVGGGGAGGYSAGTITLAVGDYNISVGLGGGQDINGQNSSINSTLSSFGGGAGGAGSDAGNDGGSGGGGGWSEAGGNALLSQGQNGGDANVIDFGNSRGSAGGGGAGEIGSDLEPNAVSQAEFSFAGRGGNGTQNAINGTNVFWGGGGGGGGLNVTWNTLPALGGLGGGGNGRDTVVGNSGINGTGGGGGGSGSGGGGNGGSGVVIIRFQVVTLPTINLDSPTNNTNFTTNTIIMNATIFDNTNITNVTLYLDDQINETNTTAGLNDTLWTFSVDGFAEGNVFWTMEACNFDNFCINASQRTFSVDSNNPVLIVFFPNETFNFHEINTNLSVNWSVNDTNLDTCILQFEGVNVTQTCSDNQTQINITNNVNKSLIFFANDTFANVNSSSVSWNYNIFSNVQDFNTTSFETELNNFTINLTYNSTSFTDIETNLYYNSTKHPTTQTGTGDDVNFSTTLSRLFVAPNIKPFFWNFRITNVTGIFDINSTEKTQAEQPILFGLCNATLTTPYVNFTFKDEGNLSILNASVPSSTFVHTLGNFTINKSITFINTTVNENYQFCLDPPNRTLHTDFTFQYESTGYQQRVVEFVQTFNSTLTTNILYLLSDADGIFVTFQVINTAEQTIENAIINASRIIDSVNTIVGTGLTNAAGTKTFWLNPNFLHTINVFKTGFPQFSTGLFPDQTAFTINLGGTAAGGEEDYTQGITVDVFPKGTLLDPNENFTFNYTLTSNFWTVTEFSFGIRDEDGNIYANETASTNGGTLTTTLNTTDNTTLIMDYNWLISGNFTNNSRTWLVYNDTLDDDWSIKTFANHLVLYIDDGLFGLENFGLAIITFLTIFIFTGIMSIRYGLVSPEAISALMFTLVLFFDTGLGLMINLNPVGAISNFPTIIMGIILLGILMRKGVR